MIKNLISLSLLAVASTAHAVSNPRIQCERPTCAALTDHFTTCKTSHILVSVQEISHVDKLVINSSSIDTIAPKAFKDITISNLTLIFTGDDDRSRPVYFMKDSFLGLPNIISLVTLDGEYSLSPNPFKQVAEGITYLRLIHTWTDRIPPEFLADFPNLIRFFLMGHRLQNITTSTFATVNKNIKKLSLREGNISFIEPSSFAVMSDLIYLNIAGNLLTQVNGAMFSGLDKLHELNLGGNRLKTISPETLSALPVTMSYLNLANNQLTVLEPSLLDKLTGMMYLYFQGNQIERIPKGVFNPLKVLKKLHLYQNRIKRIDDEAFSGTNVAWELLINQNDIEVIETDTFKGLNATKLDLSECRIMEIKPNAFEDVGVQELVLDDNQVFDVDLVDWGVGKDVDVLAGMCYY